METSSCRPWYHRFDATLDAELRVGDENGDEFRDHGIYELMIFDNTKGYSD